MYNVFSLYQVHSLFNSYIYFHTFTALWFTMRINLRRSLLYHANLPYKCTMRINLRKIANFLFLIWREFAPQATTGLRGVLDYGEFAPHTGVRGYKNVFALFVFFNDVNFNNFSWAKGWVISFRTFWEEGSAEMYKLIHSHTDFTSGSFENLMLFKPVLTNFNTTC
jgi:hypothetical protein